MKFHFLAIFLGTITDLALSFIVGPLILYLTGIYGSNPFLPHASLLLGLIAIVIGGYVTARKSLTNKIFNTSIFAGIQIVISVIGAMVVSMPLWFNITSFVLILPSALLGECLATRRK